MTDILTMDLFVIICDHSQASLLNCLGGAQGSFPHFKYEFLFKC